MGVPCTRLLSLLLVLALVVGTGGSAHAAMEGPRPTVGDWWTYQTNSTFEGGLTLGGQATLTVTAVGPERVDGVTIDGVRMSVRGEGTAAGNFTSRFISAPASGVWVLSGEEIMEMSGFKVASSVLDLEANGTLHTQPLPIPFRLSAQNTSTHRFVSDSWHLPLGIGNSTVIRSELNFTEDFEILGIPGPSIHASGRVAWNTTYAIEAEIAIDTAAGRFDSYRIRQTLADGSSALLYFAPAVGNYARTESRNGTSEVASAELVAYRYQSLEPSRFIGFAADEWALVVLLVAAAVAGLLVWRHWQRRPREETPPPEP